MKSGFSLGRKLEKRVLDSIGGLVVADAPDTLRLPVPQRDAGAMVLDLPGLGLPPVNPELERINRQLGKPASGASAPSVSSGTPAPAGASSVKPVSFPDFISGLPPTEFEKVKREYEDELEREKQKINPRPSWGGFFRRALQALGAAALTSNELDWGHIAGAVAGAALTQLPGKKFDELRRQQEEMELQSRIIEKYKPKFQIASATDEAQDRAIRRANEYQNILVREAVAAERQRTNLINESLKQRALEIRAEESRNKRFGIQTKHEEFIARMQQMQRQFDAMLTFQKERASNPQVQTAMKGFETQLRSLRDSGEFTQKRIDYYTQTLLEKARAAVAEKIVAGRENPVGLTPKSYTAQEEKALIAQEFQALLASDPLLLQLQQEADQIERRRQQVEIEMERYRHSLETGSERPSKAAKADDRPLPPPATRKPASPDVRVKPKVKPQ